MASDGSEESNSGERLSALLDGELRADAVAGACAAWRADGRMLETWHAYHLIGDVLRSDDLASPAARDAAFLNRLRERLADEPVVLAPQPLPVAAVPAQGMVAGAGARSARRWRTSAAVAAGFMAVAGVLVVMRAPLTDAAPELARAPAVPAVSASPAAGPITVASDAGVEQADLITDGRVIRDARLDRYLAAHQQFAGASALGVPSAFLRSATTDASKR